jgi:hypothetical protein
MLSLASNIQMVAHVACTIKLHHDANLVANAENISVMARNLVYLGVIAVNTAANQDARVKSTEESVLLTQLGRVQNTTTGFLGTGCRRHTSAVTVIPPLTTHFLA